MEVQIFDFEKQSIISKIIEGTYELFIVKFEMNIESESAAKPLMIINDRAKFRIIMIWKTEEMTENYWRLNIYFIVSQV